MSIEKLKTLIIGAGPAGYTAAIYAARAGLNPVLYQGLEPGGQLMLTTEVENFPGYPQGVQGPQMMEDLRAQAERFGCSIRYGLATSVEFSGSFHKVFIDEKIEIHTETIIIATGASAKWLGLETEKTFQGRGVSSCAVCDGFFYKKKDVVVVGGGDSAVEEATYLANICNKVYLLVRRNELRASKIMQARAERTPNLEILWNTVPTEIFGNNDVEGVKIKDLSTLEEKTLEVKGFFVAIGHQPNTKIFEGNLEMDEQGYIITNHKGTHTNVEGVFACGDVQDNTYRQAITAAASGCMAALDAERYLSEKLVLTA